MVSSKSWIKKYTGKNIVKGYAKWYGVDLICAIKELKINGVEIDKEYETKVKQSIESNKRNQQTCKENILKTMHENLNEFSDDNFSFIAGYTSGGAAYGIPND